MQPWDTLPRISKIHSQIPIDSPKYDDFKFDYTLINKAQCEKK